MEMYEVLKERGTINLLWLIYSQEVLEKNGYTVKLSQIRPLIGHCKNIISTLNVLGSCNLITYEYVEDDYVLCITHKGKKFIETFNKLKDIYLDKKEKEKLIKIDYSLSGIEKKILFVINKLEEEQGVEFISIKNIAREIYPTEDNSKKTSNVSRHVAKLEELNLVEKAKKGRETYVKITKSGKRNIEDISSSFT